MTTPDDQARPAVFIPQRYETLMSLVRRSSGSRQNGSRHNAVFTAAFDLLCFAATIGFGRKRTGEIAKNSNDKTSGGEVVMNVPDRKDRLLCDMIAVAHTGDHNILKDGRLKERLDIFMEYACGGLDYLMELRKVRQPRAAVELVIRGADQDDSIIEFRALIDTDDGDDDDDDDDDNDNDNGEGDDDDGDNDD